MSGSSLGPTTTPDSIAQQALRAVGANPLNGSPLAGSGATFGLADIATMLLRKLAIIAADEVPEPFNQALAIVKVQAAHDMLASRDYVDWSVSAVPSEVVEQYVMIGAAMLAPEFGRPADAEASGFAVDAIRQRALSGPRGQALALGSLAAIHTELVGLGYAAWTLDAIPLAVSDAYADLLQQAIQPAYGKADTADLREQALARIRRVALSGAYGQALAQAKIMAVHDSLVVQGLVSWPVTAIPAAYAEDYVAMAGVLLAPVMDSRQDAPSRQVDRTVWDAAEAHIRRGATIAGAQDRAADKIQAIQAEMAALGLVDWTPDAIPDYVADVIAEMASLQMGPEFGREPDPKAYAAAQMRLRRLTMGGPAGQALAEQKVRAVHLSLEARGRVRWTLYDLPAWIEEPYVMMAAVLLSPECEPPSPANPAWTMQGEMELARIVSLPSLRRPVTACYF